MSGIAGAGASLLRVRALVRKECLQILRDPSAFLIAGALPLLLLFIFGTGVSLDLRRVRLAVVVEQPSPEASSLVDAFRNSPYFDVRFARHRGEVDVDLVDGRLAGIVVLRGDFAERLGRGEEAPIQVIVDGSDPNTAALVQGYVQGVWQGWVVQESTSRASLADRPTAHPRLSAEPRFWFNANLDSRASLLPGAVAINLTLIGTLLTALVVAREWERGTMESLLSTPARRWEMLVGKIVPYLGLGLIAMAVSVAAAVWLFDVPFRGSVGALVALSLAYLATMLTLGLLISTKTRNQFVACQAALIAGFLPAFELSGFVFEIDAMPAPIRLLTRILPPRYFVSSLQTIFLAGDVPSILIPNGLVLLAFATLFLTLLVRSTPSRLE
ncbi:Inner membrane transport permease YbhS [Aquisphaera giovannonii]|uniref:Inner membrane transport permease YbhS n=1 Tax=Aquisphaera giovannonii TaxID=406548 RepID=A0A5B9VV50_9BACT|nr:ABC transporter permease [Aquisphaera giovannonii]QEH32306.1 Inner membrane transport permease YbhS [Aquisphaera giovannonii]